MTAPTPPSSQVDWSDCLDAGCGTCDACRAVGTPPSRQADTHPSWRTFHIRLDPKTNLWITWCDCGWERSDLDLVRDGCAILNAQRDHGREVMEANNATTTNAPTPEAKS